MPARTFWLLVSSIVITLLSAGLLPAASAAEVLLPELPELAPEGSPQEHLAVFAPYSSTPGRPPWAPLELAWGQTQARDKLVQILQGPAPLERSRAALALALTGCDQARDTLAESLEDPVAQVRAFSAIALCYLGDARGEQEARIALRQGPPWQRYYALVGLWRLDSADTRRYIRNSQADQDPFLTETIVAALQSTPWHPANVLQPAATERFPLTTRDLWEDLADTMVFASDYWWHRGNYDQVCRLLETALFFSPHRVDLYDNIGWLQWSLGRDERALAVLERGIEVNPDSWMAHFNLGYHYFNTKRFAEALPYLEYAAAQVEDWWVPLHIYAHALERMDRLPDALAVWEETLKRFPEDKPGQMNLQRVRQELEEVPTREQ